MAKKREPNCYRLDTVYRIENTDVSGRWAKYYGTKDGAIRAAEKAVGKPLIWTRGPKGVIFGGDLLHTLYSIEPIYAEPA